MIKSVFQMIVHTGMISRSIRSEMDFTRDLYKCHSYQNQYRGHSITIYKRENQDEYNYTIERNSQMIYMDMGSTSAYATWIMACAWVIAEIGKDGSNFAPIDFLPDTYRNKISPTSDREKSRSIG